ncbi:MAG: hypothetical protein CMO80_11520 [Verrucomicrobiales bacterium]|nr:hypothetical protein [Verrucomicrobiales bacterium]|tara:strand:+ start:7168 stop:7971 length:804 start_codon:yes stop_codon:yes gene_type:complete
MTDMSTPRKDPDFLQIRVHGDDNRPTLIYLPGIHGDWTLVTAFRLLVQDRVRFVEFTYPRTTSWSLEEYAAGVVKKLDEKGIRDGWLLAESFGSQLVWPMVGKGMFKPEGIILAGGFGPHPFKLGVHLSKLLCAAIPMAGVWLALAFYKLVSRIRFRNQAESMAAVEEFVERRTYEDKCAMTHRLRLIAANQPKELASKIEAPIYHLSGLWDIVVPWGAARRWVKKHVPKYQGQKLVAAADHTVLPMTPKQSAESILGWMGIDHVTA